LFWSGDFSSGTFSQWSGGSAGSIFNAGTAQFDAIPAIQGNTVASVVTSPTYPGKFVASFVDNDTTGSGASHDSAGAYNSPAETHSAPGEDTYYGWSVYFPSSNSGNWATNNDWNLFLELMQSSPFCQGFQFGIDTQNSVTQPGVYYDTVNPAIYGEMMTDSNGVYGTYPQYRWEDSATTFPYDQWIGFVVHVKWASDTTGTFEIWKNGVKVLALNNVRTLCSGASGFVTIIMNYRQAWTRPTTHLIGDLRVGSSYSAVEP
jgi:hypothetical protein